MEADLDSVEEGVISKVVSLICGETRYPRVLVDAGVEFECVYVRALSVIADIMKLCFNVLDGGV